jgi:hypothetical protein
MFGQNVDEHNPAPSPSGHPLLSGPPTLNDIHQIFTRGDKEPTGKIRPLENWWWTGSRLRLRCALIMPSNRPMRDSSVCLSPVFAGTNRPRTPWTVLATSPLSPSMILSGINWQTRWMGCDARGRRGQCNHQWFRSRRSGSRKWSRSSPTQWSAHPPRNASSRRLGLAFPFG